MVLDSHPGVRFIGVGQGPLAAEVTALHAELNLGQAFQLLGYQPDAARLIAAMDIFCLSSLKEGLPVALMESLVLGVPVVATSVGGVPEAVTDGQEGHLVPPSDPSKLAAGIGRLACSESLRSSMSVAAGLRGQDFNIDRAVRIIESRYRQVLEERRQIRTP